MPRHHLGTATSGMLPHICVRLIQVLGDLFEKRAVDTGTFAATAAVLVTALKDKSSLCRAAAMSGIESALAKNPYGARLDLKWFQDMLMTEGGKLQQCEAHHAAADDEFGVAHFSM